LDIEIEIAAEEVEEMLGIEEGELISPVKVKDVVTCNVCNKQFSKRNSLMRHVKELHERYITLFHCPANNCNRIFKRKPDIKRHIEKFHDKYAIMGDIKETIKKNKFFIEGKAEELKREADIRKEEELRKEADRRKEEELRKEADRRKEEELKREADRKKEEELKREADRRKVEEMREADRRKAEEKKEADRRKVEEREADGKNKEGRKRRAEVGNEAERGSEKIETEAKIEKKEHTDKFGRGNNARNKEEVRRCVVKRDLIHDFKQIKVDECCEPLPDCGIKGNRELIIKKINFARSEIKRWTEVLLEESERLRLLDCQNQKDKAEDLYKALQKERKRTRWLEYKLKTKEINQ
jgi:hypothetical protein